MGGAVLNVKALVGTFNQEKAPTVGAFTVIVIVNPRLAFVSSSSSHTVSTVHVLWCQCLAAA